MVSKRVSSSDWTGPIDRTMRRGAFTHRIGEFGATTDYAWLNSRQPFTLALPPELKGIIRLAALLLLSPLPLAAAWLAGGIGNRDMVLSDRSDILFLWGCLTVATAFWQLISRSTYLIMLRTALLGGLLAATIAGSIGYVFVAHRSHATAAAGEPQRVFQYAAGSRRSLVGRRTVVLRHQRADGTDLEGRSKRAPMAYGHCITAQQIAGPNGFRWLHVVERMPPPRAGQLSWPIRREDCFSSKSLSQVGSYP